MRRNVVAVLVAALLFVSNVAAQAQQYFVPPSGSQINVVPIDPVSGYQGGVVAVPQVAKWGDTSRVLRSNIVKWIDGNYFVVSAASASATSFTIDYVSPSGFPIASYALTGVTGVDTICLDANGQVWGAIPGTNKVFAFNPGTTSTTVYTIAITGATNKFGMGQFTSTPIILGADSNLWIPTYDTTFIGASTLVVIDNSGTKIAEYTLPDFPSNASNLVLGSDNRIWFAAGQKLDAIDTAGTVGSYAMPTGYASFSVYGASNGWLYVVNTYGIMKVDISGAISEYVSFPDNGKYLPSLPTGSGCEFGGKLWLGAAGRVLSVDLTTSKVDSYPLTGVNTPGRLTAFDTFVVGVNIPDAAIGFGDGLAFKLTPTGAGLYQVAVNGKVVNNDNPLPITAETPSFRPAYSAAVTPFTPPATPTDMVVISGSATKTVKIQRIEATLTASSTAIKSLYLIKRSDTNTGGTTVASTPVPLDSSSGVATCSVVRYSANPATLGTAAGNITVNQVIPVASAAVSFTGSPSVVLYDAKVTGQPITLRGTSETLAINFNGAALTASSVFGFTITLTEE